MNRIMDGVREYDEGLDVTICTLKKHLTFHNAISLAKNHVTFLDTDRYIIEATNSVGNGFAIDLVDIIEWVKKNKPELLS